MNIVFRVDSSSQIGAGHVMRCLTLAQALKENSANVEFIAQQLDKINAIKLVGIDDIVKNLENFQ